MGDEVDQKVVLHRLDSIDKTLERITASIDRLVLVEERQAQTRAAVDRAFTAIAALELQVKGGEKRVVEIEKRLPEVTRTSVWVDRAVVFTVAFACASVLKKIGLL